MRQIVLLGLRGSGKSTLGRLLARGLGVGFVDLDEVTPRRHGVATAGELLRGRGEGAFREAEAWALGQPEVVGAGVLALGGGTPTHEASLRALREYQDRGAVLVYLRGSAETLAGRLAASDLSTRPSLTGADPVSEVALLLKKRDAVYCALADEVVEIDGLDEAGALAALRAVVG